MSVELILEDWADYDDKKISNGRDARFFACTELWERDYLKEKIRNYFPDLTEEQIDDAIIDCCSILKSPYARKEFIEFVIIRLRAIK